MKRVATFFLRSAIIGMGLGVSAIVTLLLPSLWSDIATEFPRYSFAVYAVFIALVIAAIPFFFGLYGAWKLLACIDKGMAFSRRSAKAVRNIALAATTISVIFIISMPFFYIWGDQDDAPGLIIIGIVLVGIPLVIAMFALLLHQLITDATDLKSEHELTV